ncbi:MAG TPA: nicotinamide-nucleotide adenylyltransferase [Candidatus Nanoarchaeia archaeon]|nr:nicotinamide-nucleotide adenylyltransferase [Candidatus Nanoarchaeia archaeon]
MNIDECIARGFLQRIEPDARIEEKELRESDYDFGKAEKAFEDEDYKWSIIKSYYSMLHAARAVLFNLGFREKRHFAVSAVLEDLNKKGVIESRAVNDFSAAVSSREDADYHYIHTRDGAKTSLLIADEFIERMKSILKQDKIALFIGRFQPFHKAHLSDVKLALKECSKVIIAIGSSQESGTKENPFTYEERREMIKDTLEAHNVSSYDIVPVPDIFNDEKWVEHVRKVVPEFDIVYTGNEFTAKLFLERKTEVRRIQLIPDINATEIRKRIICSKDWEELVPKEVFDYIRKINGGRLDS